MDYQIRRAKIEDLEILGLLMDKLIKKEHEEFDKTINLNYIPSEVGQNYLRKRIEDEETGVCFVAEAEGQIVGYMMGGLIEPEDYRVFRELAEGETMFVDDMYRNQGIGSEFAKLFEDWCRSKGVKRICLIASTDNDEAIKLYRRLGYKDYSLKLEKDI